MSDFVHLHVHSAYSLLDGAGKVEDIVRAAEQKAMKAVALTDHGVMYGCVDFYKAARDHGIKPLLGCEVYVAPRTRYDCTPQLDDRLNHLVVLAENEQGYRNLMSLVSRASLEGFYYKPRVDKDLLSQYSMGLIALSGCLAGEIPELLLREDDNKAAEVALAYRDIFGKDNFFLELQDQGLPQQRTLNRKLIELARTVNLGTVATNDVHYVNREDSAYHDLLLCIQTGKSINDENRLRFASDQFYLKSESEMAELFGEIPSSLSNTGLIADRCQVELNLGNISLPTFPLPGGYTAESYLEQLCIDGINRRFGQPSAAVKERLHFELGVIHEMRYANYFLIMWDLIQFAHSQNIRVGPGRGSAAGSMVAYSLGITDIDPLAKGLLFERFLNPERISMPDIDVDFADNRRDEIIEYVTATYGADRVAQIITFGTMAARAAIRDVGRAYDLPYSDVDRIAKLVLAEPGYTLAAALQTNRELMALYEREDWVHRLVDGAQKLEGLPRHVSTHAAGVVIAAEPLLEYVPLQKSSDGIVTTQYPWETIEEIGLLKMDFLGLRTLTVIEETIRLIAQNRGYKLDISQLDPEDEPTYKLLSSGNTFGVFQLEGSGVRALIRELKPCDMNDLTALVALYRPGPLASGMAEEYIARRHGDHKVHYLHPKLETILNETYGVILYQEQVMQIASDLAGFSLAQADLLRRAMGKKQPEVLAGERQRFVEGAANRDIDRKTATEVFQLMEYFAGYGFNKSHSAAYGLLAYQTAYLKANYQSEFMAALLTSVIGDSDKVTLYIEECRRMDIEVMPPDVNNSEVDFSVDEGRIRIGLATLKNTGKAPMVAIIQERLKGGPFSSIVDLCRRIDLQIVTKRVLENLIRAGATGSLPGNRAQQLAVIDNAVDEGLFYQRQQTGGQGMLWGSMPVTTETVSLPTVKEVPAELRLAWEKEIIGFYLSGHPLDENAKWIDQIISVNSAELRSSDPGKSVVMAGIITEMRKVVTRRGQAMAFLTVEDLTGKFDAVVFPSVFSDCSWLELDSLVVLSGRSADEIGSEPKILVDKLQPLGTALQLCVKLESPNQVDNLRMELSPYRGQSSVLLFFSENSKARVVKMDPECKVQISNELLGRLHSLFGEENIAVKVRKQSY